jgi:hypothetical protein
MTVLKDEVERLRSALHRSSEGASSREKSEFIGRLKAISLDTLRERLRTRAITSRWKRDLAVAELADRLQETETGPRVAAKRSRKTRPWGMWVAGVVIALCCAIVVYTGFLIWMS